METIKINIDEAYKIKVESEIDFDNSFFSEIYASAREAVEEIYNNRINIDESESGEKKNSRNEYNNIIAFIGERGTGKTSVMISFLESLEKERFEKLDVVDPSLFSGNESIFEVIIGSMFNEFQNKYQVTSGELDNDNSKANELLEGFQTVYRNIRVLKNNRKELYNEDIDETIIETLSKLASGVTTRASFENLVKKYLDYFKDDYHNKFLVIPIDDLDMNIEYSPIMIEEIRKYLKINHVIILMAMKMEQMSNLIEQMYMESFSTMINSKKFTEDPKEMAAKYMEKLLPEGRKFRLPSIKILPDEAGKLIEIYKKSEQLTDPIIKGSLENVVLKLTYKKTGLVFVKNIDGTHYLIPDNLRELHDYISVFYKLPDDAKETGKGLEVFEKYFMTTWIKNNLPLKYMKFLNDFSKVSTVLKNKYIVTKIGNLIEIEINDEEFNKQVRAIQSDNSKIKKSDFLVRVYELVQIMDKGNKSENISFGDVLLLLNVYNDYYDNDNIKKLNFAIKTMYSINFTKKIFNNESQYENNIKHIKTLIGGKILNQNERKFLMSNRDYAKLSYNKLEIKQKNIKEYVKKIASYFEKSSDIFPSNELNVIEYLNLFILNFNEIDEKNYRSEDIIYYDTKPRFEDIDQVGTSRYAYFNILAFAFNLIDTEGYLKKIFIDILNDNEENFSVIQENSMFNTIEYKEWYDQYKVVLPIYSVELLEKIFRNTEIKIKKKLKNRMGDDWGKFMKAFMNSVSDAIDDIIESDDEYFKDVIVSTNFKKAFEECPIVSVIVQTDKMIGTKVNNEVFDINDIFNGMKNAINANINDKLISDLIINRSKFKKYSMQSQIASTGFKGVLSRFILLCEANKDDFKDTTIDKLNQLRTALDDDSSQKALKSTSDEIIEIIDNEIKRLKIE